jgi:hypothetical protein
LRKKLFYAKKVTKLPDLTVVIYNLNLGQSPLLNPTTISSKVTSALIKAAADNLEGEHNGSLAIAGEMVNDLLSQVKSMNLFGKGTKPCKDPKNPSKDGTFYTVPVKLSFNQCCGTGTGTGTVGTVTF